jgi:hypothetical protein
LRMCGRERARDGGGSGGEHRHAVARWLDCGGTASCGYCGHGGAAAVAGARTRRGGTARAWKTRAWRGKHGRGEEGTVMAARRHGGAQVRAAD